MYGVHRASAEGLNNSQTGNFINISFCCKVVNLLAETQEQLRKQRKKGMPTVRGGSLFPSMGAAPQPDSIASELESSLYSELSLDSGISADRMYVILSFRNLSI